MLSNMNSVDHTKPRTMLLNTGIHDASSMMYIRQCCMESIAAMRIKVTIWNWTLQLHDFCTFWMKISEASRKPHIHIVIDCVGLSTSFSMINILLGMHGEKCWVSYDYPCPYGSNLLHILHIPGAGPMCIPGSKRMYMPPILCVLYGSICVPYSPGPA